MKQISSLLTLGLLAVLSSCTDSSSSYQHSLDGIPFNSSENGRWGMVTPDGTLLFDDEFRNAPSPSFNGRFFYQNDKSQYEMYKIVDGRLSQIGEPFVDYIPFVYEKVTPAVRKGEPICLIDLDGNVVRELKEVGGHEVTSINAFSCGVAQVQTTDGIGCVNTAGDLVVPAKYCMMHNFSDGVAIAIDNRYEDDIPGSIVDVIDTQGNVVGSFRWDKYDMWATGYYRCGLFAVGNSDDEDQQWGLINKQGEVVVRLSSKNQGITDWTERHFIFRDDESHYGLRSIEGEDLIRAKYDGLTYATTDGKLLWASISVGEDRNDYKLLNEKGEEVSHETYREVKPFYNEKVALVRVNRDWIFIDTKGQEVKSKADIRNLAIDYEVAGTMRLYDDSGWTISSNYVDIDGLITAAAITRDQIGAYGINMKSQQIANAWFVSQDDETEAPTPAEYHKDRLIYRTYFQDVIIEYDFYYNAYLTDANPATGRQEWTNVAPAYVRVEFMGAKADANREEIIQHLRPYVQQLGTSVLEDTSEVYRVAITDYTEMKVEPSESGVFVTLLHNEDYYK